MMTSTQELFSAVKVFSATKTSDRSRLGEVVTDWLRSRKVDVVDAKVVQSSDYAFHCLSIILFLK